ncbi:hypothetical protein NQ318_019666 [Aromia moschata]|uniref:Uncharacterized protein n=1 Tax=Aromia moschata TaxID=1265417 RepID=A0AAV8Z3Z5_9CUCU|nr:hypothetical protein NQ318_019666 [Aromia moschata]
MKLLPKVCVKTQEPQLITEHNNLMGSNPVRIAAPPELAGMTLENRLVSYDWDNQFHSFQEATIRGSFKPLCWTAQSTLLPNTDKDAHYPNISKPYVRNVVDQCNYRRYSTEGWPGGTPILELDGNHIEAPRAARCRGAAARPPKNRWDSAGSTGPRTTRPTACCWPSPCSSSGSTAEPRDQRPFLYQPLSRLSECVPCVTISSSRVFASPFGQEKRNCEHSLK